jgi:uncharacterized membrane protein
MTDPKPIATERQEGAALTPVMERNMQTLIAHARAEEQGKGLQAHLADRITAFTGSMRFVYLHIMLFGLWLIINLGWTPLPRFDPSFVFLAIFASIEAIFLSTFVLISQNRQAVLAQQRSELNLQISLLAEHEVTHMLTLVTAIAEQMGIAEAQNPELAELTQEVRPEKVLDKIEENQQKSDAEASL